MLMPGVSGQIPRPAPKDSKYKMIDLAAQRGHFECFKLLAGGKEH